MLIIMAIGLSNGIWKGLRSKAYTARILLKLGVVETLLQGEGSCPRFIFGTILVLEDTALFSVYNVGRRGWFGIFGECDPTHSFGDRPKFSGKAGTWEKW